MNLIFLYGPPATGKLTIATKLAELTGYKIFHNHLTQDLVRELYPEFDQKRFGLVGKLRLDVFGYAAENNTDLIFTYVYTGDDFENTFISRVREVVTEKGGKVHFVQLSAPLESLLERVSGESRESFGKLTDGDKLRAFLKSYDAYVKVPFDHELDIDTSKLEPEEAAKKIVEHYNL